MLYELAQTNAKITFCAQHKKSCTLNFPLSNTWPQPTLIEMSPRQLRYFMIIQTFWIKTS